MSKMTAREIRQWDCDVKTEIGWLPARPVNYKVDSMLERLKFAWGVLIGKYDALDWEQNN